MEAQFIAEIISIKIFSFEKNFHFDFIRTLFSCTTLHSLFVIKICITFTSNFDLEAW